MTVAAIESLVPIWRGPALALAGIGPVAVGAIFAAKAGDASPIAAAPAIVFGVLAATSPALYIATAAVGAAPSLGRVAQAFATALGAFGIALAGLLPPAVFLSLSSLSVETTAAIASCALLGAGLIGLRRLERELALPTPGPGQFMFAVWAFATLGIAGRLWWDLVAEVAL